MSDEPARRIPRRFDPREALATPEHVEKALAGSEPRDIALAALATVAIVARWWTTTQFEQYVQQNHAEMQQVAKTLAVDTGQRVVVANASGRVFLDSSNSPLGTTLDPSVGTVDYFEKPAPTGAVVVVRQIDGGDGTLQTTTDTLYPHESRCHWSAGSRWVRDWVKVCRERR